MITIRQSSLALGVATPGTPFLSLIPGLGMRDALVTTLPVQVGRSRADGAAESAAAADDRLTVV
jgi:hypothetical protein